MFRRISLSSCILLASGAATAIQLTAAEKKTIRVMFYNTYNLFDTEHDVGKDDWTFLPKNYPGKVAECNKIQQENYRKECLSSDWQDSNLEIKLGQLKTAIEVNSPGRKPDVLGVCEVENENVVKMLADKLGYSHYAVTDSPDKRGIDVALLFNTSSDLKFIDSKEHEYPAFNDKPLYTRNLLEAEFELGGENLNIFVNHWPSQAAPSVVREHVAKQVKKIVDQRLARTKPPHVLMMGDFNTVAEDYPHALNSVLTDKTKPKYLLDAHSLFMGSSAPREVKNLMPHGTYFYPPSFSWDRLDRFFLSSSLSDDKGVDLIAESYRIGNADTIVTKYEYKSSQFSNKGSVIEGVPFRANINAKSVSDAGFGDHFPILVDIGY